MCPSNRSTKFNVTSRSETPTRPMTFNVASMRGFNRLDTVLPCFSSSISKNLTYLFRCVAHDGTKVSKYDTDASV